MREVHSLAFAGARLSLYPNCHSTVAFRHGTHTNQHHSKPHTSLVYYLLLSFQSFIVVLLGRSWQQPDNLILPAMGIEPIPAAGIQPATMLLLTSSPHINLVPMTGLEPARRKTNAPKTFASTIPPHRHICLIYAREYKLDLLVVPPF